MIKVLQSGIALDNKSDVEKQVKSAILTKLPDYNFDINTPTYTTYQLLTELYFNMSLGAKALIEQYDIFKASGVGLAKITSSRSVYRKLGQNANATCICYGNENTTIPIGTQVKKNDGTIFQTQTTNTITKNKAQQIIFEPINIANNIIFSLKIVGIVFSYTANSSDTADSIVNNFINQIQSNISLINILQVVNDGSKLKISTLNLVKSYSFDVVSNFSIYEVGSPIYFYCVDSGVIEVPANAINKINTAVVGFSSVNNLVEGTAGTLAEDDTDLRLRSLGDGIYAQATCTPLGLQNALINIQGVTYAKVYDNKSDLPDADGYLPHSVIAVVEGGDENEIGNVLRGISGNSGVAGGIETNGSVTIPYIDPFGVQHNFYIERPITKYIHIRLTLSGVQGGDYSFLNDITTQTDIKNLVADFGNNTFNIGNDIRKYDILNAVTGLYRGLINITIELAKTTLINGVPTFANIDNLSIARLEKPLFSADRVIIV